MEKLEKDTPSELPGIVVLSSIKPARRNFGNNSDSKIGELHSPNLAVRLKKYDQHESDLWQKFTHTDDPIEEQRLGKRLAKLYLLRESTNLALSSVHKQEETTTEDEGYIASSPYVLRPGPLHAERFTELAKGIYGDLTQPRIAQAASSTIQLVEQLPDGDENFPMLRRVGAALSVNDSRAKQELLIKDELHEQLKHELDLRYQTPLGMIDQLPDDDYSPEQMQLIFSELLASLAEVDEAWSKWRAVVEPKKGMFSVHSRKKTISIGADRQYATKADLRKLFVHEICVHAQRSVNGEKFDDPEQLLQYGTPGYIDAEEGLGVLFEYIISGEMPTKAKDRYLDIALATGDAGLILSHAEILQLKIEREIARRQLVGETPVKEEVRKQAQSETDRIFRGGDGKIHEEDYYGHTRRANAVFVKDIVYFQALQPLIDYIERLADKGQTPSEILDFLQSGKFDPTNKTHLEYVKKWTGKNI